MFYPDDMIGEWLDSLGGVTVWVVNLLDMVGQPARHERRAAWAAVDEGVVPIQLDALGDESVGMRRLHFAIVPADIVPARIVSHEEDEMRLVGRSLEARRG